MFSVVKSIIQPYTVFGTKMELFKWNLFLFLLGYYNWFINIIFKIIGNTDRENFKTIITYAERKSC